jgi:hypothetical protein
MKVIEEIYVISGINVLELCYSPGYCTRRLTWQEEIKKEVDPMEPTS